MKKNVYHIYQDSINGYCNVRYREAESAQQAFIDYVQEIVKFKENEEDGRICIPFTFIEEITIDNRKQKTKDMKNKTILK